MPSDDWATRHPELVHWLQRAEESLRRTETERGGVWNGQHW